jgi:hypothetical protein
VCTAHDGFLWDPDSKPLPWQHDKNTACLAIAILLFLKGNYLYKQGRKGADCNTIVPSGYQSPYPALAALFVS